MLETGTRVGSYEVTALLGEGGMGAVYRARDTRLNRDVAIKVLPTALAADPDRVARFRREAQVVASLTHPNIAAIFGLEEAAGANAIVMELVEGPTLAERLATGPMPLDEVIAVAKQIAEAVEYAHELGIIHRDLKPANIKIAPTGTVKVLDFGLAKALIDAPAAASQANSPTLSLAATQAGLILGTAAYMSPEQAKGKPADRRADIWSFGIVLYEMLSGRAAYSGETVSETMAQVMMREPDWSALPATTPARLNELVKRCLVKDPRSRLQSIGEARIVLERAGQADAAGEDAAASGGQAAVQVPVRARRREWIWAGAAALSLAAAVAMAVRARSTPTPEPRTVRFDVATPESPQYVSGIAPQGMASLSPDGRTIAYVAQSGESRQRMLWLHTLESGTARPLAATEGVSPFMLSWSPDSRHLVFVLKRTLRRLAVAGGSSQAIGSAPEIGHVTWGANDVILLTAGPGPLQRIQASGGELAPASTLDAQRQEVAHRFPHFLPNGRHYSFLALARDGGLTAWIGELDSDRRWPLAGIQSAVQYANGHALFLREGSVMAQPFDLERLELTGEASLVVDRVTTSQIASAPFSVASDGTLVYRNLQAMSSRQLVWFDRTGKQVGTAGPPGPYNDFELSLDDRHVAFEAGRPDEPAGDIFALDIETGVISRVTTHQSREADPVWAPNGQSIVFRSDRDGGHLYERAYGAVGDDTLIHKSEMRESPDHYSPDGRYIVFTAQDDVWALPRGAEAPLVRVTNTPFTEGEGRVSPDGRWIAYESDEPGQQEIFIQSFPEPGPKRQVSVNGGSIPRWSHDGRELYFVGADFSLMAVGVKAGAGSLVVGAPEPLFATRLAGTQSAEGNYAVSSTGRFLINQAVGERGSPPITVVLNWLAGAAR